MRQDRRQDQKPDIASIMLFYRLLNATLECHMLLLLVAFIFHFDLILNGRMSDADDISKRLGNAFSGMNTPKSYCATNIGLSHMNIRQVQEYSNLRTVGKSLTISPCCGRHISTSNHSLPENPSTHPKTRSTYPQAPPCARASSGQADNKDYGSTAIFHPRSHPA